ncbi:MAG: tetratricopeptide repeat protein [Vicingaceae bacterium]
MMENKTITVTVFLILIASLTSCSLKKTINKGWMHLDAKEYSQAEKYFERAQKKNPKLYDPYLGEAYLDFSNGDYYNAIKNFHKANSYFSTSQNYGRKLSIDYIHNGLAESYDKVKDYENRTKYFKIIADSYKNSKWHCKSSYNVGIYYFYQQDFNNALDYFLIVKEKCNDFQYYEDAMSYIARSYYYSNNYEESSKAFTEILNLFPNSNRESDIKYGAKSFYFIENYEKSLELFSKLLELKPEIVQSDEFLFYYGMSNYYLGNYKESAKNLATLSSQMNSERLYKDVDYYAGSSFYKLDKASTSTAFLEKYLNNKFYKPEDKIKDAAFKTSIYYYSIRNYRKAIEFMEKCFDIEPSANTIYNLALFNSKNGSYKKSLEHLLKLYDYEEYEELRKKVIRNIASFRDLHKYDMFNRWLAGKRRLLIRPLAAVTEEGELSGDDLFLTVSYNNQLILATREMHNRDYVEWNNELVIFDYKLGETIDIVLFDADVMENEPLGRFTYNKLPKNLGSIILDTLAIRIKLKIEDSDFSVYTSGIYTPEPAKLEEVLAGMGIAVVAISALSLEDGNPISRIVSCFSQTAISSSIKDPAIAGIISEATASVIENKGFSLAKTSTNVISNGIVNELRANGHYKAANLVNSGMFLECLTAK